MKFNYKLSKEKIADLVGNVVPATLFGGAMDYASGLGPLGVLASRAYAAAINTPTAIPYARWREKIYEKTNTTEKSHKLKKWFADCIAFDSFQLPLYTTVIAAGSLVSEGRIDFEKVMDGSTYMLAVSPLIAPAMGLGMNLTNKLFKIRTAAEKVSDKILENQENADENQIQNCDKPLKKLDRIGENILAECQAAVNAGVYSSNINTPARQEIYDPAFSMNPVNVIKNYIFRRR